MVDHAEKNYQRGQWAEQLALDYLVQKKLELLSCNYRCAVGEIDIIMLDHETIVFIEVRYRANNNYIHVLETISEKKCIRIIKTSRHFLQNTRQLSRKPCRFDIITITGENNNPEIVWIKDAFQA